MEDCTLLWLQRKALPPPCWYMRGAATCCLRYALSQAQSTLDFLPFFWPSLNFTSLHLHFYVHFWRSIGTVGLMPSSCGKGTQILGLTTETNTIYWDRFRVVWMAWKQPYVLIVDETLCTLKRTYTIDILVEVGYVCECIYIHTHTHTHTHTHIYI